MKRKIILTDDDLSNAIILKKPTMEEFPCTITLYTFRNIEKITVYAHPRYENMHLIIKAACACQFVKKRLVFYYYESPTLDFISHHVGSFKLGNKQIKVLAEQDAQPL